MLSFQVLYLLLEGNLHRLYYCRIFSDQICLIRWEIKNKVCSGPKTVTVCFQNIYINKKSVTFLLFLTWYWPSPRAGLCSCWIIDSSKYPFFSHSWRSCTNSRVRCSELTVKKKKCLNFFFMFLALLNLQFLSCIWSHWRLRHTHP